MKSLDADLNNMLYSESLFKHSLSFVLLFFYVIIHFCSFITRFDYVALELLFFVCFTFCLKKISTAFIVGIFFFFITFVRYVSYHSGTTGYFAPVYHLMKYFRVIFIPIIISVFNNLAIKEKRFLIMEILFCICITNLISLYYVSLDDLAIRYRGMKNGIPNDDTYPGIIRFPQVFASSFINFVLLVTIIHYRHQIGIKLIILSLVLVLNTVMLIKSQLMTPILCFCFLLIVYLFLYKYKNKLLSFFLLVVLPFLFYYKTIAKWLLEHLDGIKSEYISKRIEGILNMLISGDVLSSSAINNRMHKIDISWNSFMQSPWFGVGYGQYSINVVGSHQDWFDIMAVSGLFGFIIILSIIYFSAKIVLKKLDNDFDKNVFISALVVFFVLGFLDPCLDICIFLSVFAIIPNFAILFKRRTICCQNLHLYH